MFILFLKISYLIKINTILSMCHIKTHVELSNMINVIKISYLNMTNYDCNVTFDDVTIFK